ncbi:MAG: L-seryl-tRNA(Sec) selenium transferase [Deltaproteobacteria bacterium]|nr:L-seryl-tRNA(Sec) selenium transferase [Deltaproteobacteria bacterium]
MVNTDKKALFKKIPAVDRLLDTPRIIEASAEYPRSLVLRAIHQVLDEIRKDLAEGGESKESSLLKIETISEKVVERIVLLAQSSLRPVINATGIIVHTNLGRSILAEKVLKRFGPIAGGYSNLEYDIEQGERGSRYTHVEDILKELTSAEGVMVVNNNAGAVLLSIETLARDREVIVSRGQLVEIGGSFRIPDVMRKSGAVMIEVGTTNKTHLQDYEEVIGPDTALLLSVHKSNFHIVGFTQDIDASDLVKLGNKYGIPVMEDLGSGCLINFSEYGIPKEPTVQDVLRQGVDLVTFSGDKLLGGPQAGIILGRKDLIESIKKNPLTRALRIDKLTLLALEETLKIYRDEKAAIREIPTLRMICQPYSSLKTKGQRLAKMIGKLPNTHFSLDQVDGISRAGGGAFPLLELPTRMMSLTPKKLPAHRMEEWLRFHTPPIIVRVEKDQVLLDLRTIQGKEMKIVAQAIRDLASL